MNVSTHARSATRRGRVTRLATGMAALGLVVACSSPADDADEQQADTAPTADTVPTVDPVVPADSTAPGDSAAPDDSSTPVDSVTPDDTSAPDDTDDAGRDDTGPATLEPVVVAVLYPDVSVAADFGFAEEVSDFAPVFDALMDDANARGGIAGHEIDLEMVQFDLLVAGDAVRACLTATQDLDAQIVIGAFGVFGDPIPCVTEQNETLMITSDGAPAEFYDRADGRLFTLTPSKDETQLAILGAFADELAAAPFALFSSLEEGGDNEAVQSALLPALTDAGLEPAVTVVLDNDTEVAASQIPIEVEKLRSAGVETVVSTAGFFVTAPFATALQAAGVDVQWVGSDAAGFAGNLYASQMPPEQLDGAAAVTVHSLGWEGAGQDEPEALSACRARAGELLGTEVALGSVDVGGAVEACNYADILVEAGRLVEGELNPTSFAAALHRLTDIELVDFGPAGFGEDDVTAANAVREISWSADCECWSVVGEYEPIG